MFCLRGEWKKGFARASQRPMFAFARYFEMADHTCSPEGRL